MGFLVLAEERGTIRDITPDSFDRRFLDQLNIRSRFNADLSYYLVDCAPYEELEMSEEFILASLEQSYKDGKLLTYQNVKRI